MQQNLTWFLALCFYREAGILIKNVDVTGGDVYVVLNEDFLIKKRSTNTNSLSGEIVKETNAAGGSRKQEKKHPILAITKSASMFPEKVCKF